MRRNIATLIQRECKSNIRALQDEILLTPLEVMEILNITARKLWRLSKSRQLTPIIQGGRRFYKIGEVYNLKSKGGYSDE